MHAFDLRAKKAGKLMAMSQTEKRRGNKVIWDCVCACGRHRLVLSNKFVRSLITGCLNCDPLWRPRTRLGLSATGEYSAWQTARSGWPDFQEFLRALGLRPEGYKIGRLDPKKPHGSGNTAWVPVHPYVGKRYGRLEVLSVIRTADGKLRYRCKCDCGRTFDRSTRKRFGSGSHCGDNVHHLIHGHCRGPKNSPTFVSWERMLTRCYNPKCDRYKSYGAKRVRICRRWHKFENFLADMGERPGGKTLGRFLDRGSYSSWNCAWMNRAEQGLNMRNNDALRKWESMRAKVRKPSARAEDMRKYCAGDRGELYWTVINAVSVEFQVDFPRTLAAITYIASKGIEDLTMYKILKILFLADRHHLVRYGRTITGDRYAALHDGPVPSRVYDFFGKQVLEKPFSSEGRRIVASLAFDRNEKYPVFRALRC
jgi:hypothetical protein